MFFDGGSFSEFKNAQFMKQMNWEFWEPSILNNFLTVLVWSPAV